VGQHGCRAGWKPPYERGTLLSYTDDVERPFAFLRTQQLRSRALKGRRFNGFDWRTWGMVLRRYPPALATVASIAPTEPPSPRPFTHTSGATLMAYESCCGHYHCCSDWACPYRREQYGPFRLLWERIKRQFAAQQRSTEEKP
jgi:hypothetical protein